MEGKIYRKRKAYMKWYYFDHNDYPADWKLRASKSPLKKVKIAAPESPPEQNDSPENSPEAKNRESPENRFIIQ
jgi:hypothetical protein